MQQIRPLIHAVGDVPFSPVVIKKYHDKEHQAPPVLTYLLSFLVDFNKSSSDTHAASAVACFT